MKIAVLLPATGCPGTLAETAFHGALMEGFAGIGVEARVVGLALHHEWWRPEALGACDTGAPWLPPSLGHFGDRAEAARRGIFSATSCPHGRCSPRWRLELLLERELLQFAPEGNDRFVLADTRSYLQLRLACRVAHRMGWRVVVFSNEALTDLQIDPATRDDYTRCVTHCTEGIWAVSEHLADYWKALGIPEDHIFVSPLVVRPSSFSQSPVPPGSSLAAYLGNLSHREIDNLLAISQSVVARVPEFRLIIYGDATEAARDALDRRVDEHGLSGVVSVRPPVPPIDVPRVLEHADVLLLPRSRGEFSSAGFPNKLGEYLASGRPVVVTGVGDIPKYVRDGETGLVVAPDDNQAFADAVVRVLTTPALAHALGTAGQQVAAQRLGADLVAGRLVDFMRSLRPASGRLTRGERADLRAVAASLLPDPTLLRRNLVRLFPGVRRIRRTRG